jgi:hypothetical protein
LQQLWRFHSLLFNRKSKTCEKKVLDINMRFVFLHNFCSKCFHSDEYLASYAETHVGRHMKCPLLFTDFNQNWNVSTYFGKTPHC